MQRNRVEIDGAKYNFKMSAFEAAVTGVKM